MGLPLKSPPLPQGRLSPPSRALWIILESFTVSVLALSWPLLRCPESPQNSYLSWSFWLKGGPRTPPTVLDLTNEVHEGPLHVLKSSLSIGWHSRLISISVVTPNKGGSPNQPYLRIAQGSAGTSSGLSARLSGVRPGWDPQRHK